MAVYILKAIALFGVILNVVLMYRKIKEIRADTSTDGVFGMTGEELWQEQKTHWKPNAFVGFVANFFDTLGIGSFAPSSTMFKLFKSVDDINVPGTLNVGDTVAVCLEAFLFFDLVDMDPLTLILMLVSSVLGAYLMAGIVSRFDRKRVRFAMFVGLFILASIMLMRWLEVGPFGSIGTELGLRGFKLVVAVVVNFVLGALMSIGVGLYAPCMALCVILGLDVGCAFPAMMGSCAFLMAFGNGPKFIKEGRFDMHASVMQAVFGAVGVFCAYFIVKSLPLRTLTLIVVIVCFITSFLYLHDAIKKGSEA